MYHCVPFSRAPRRFVRICAKGINVSARLVVADQLDIIGSRMDPTERAEQGGTKQEPR